MRLTIADQLTGVQLSPDPVEPAAGPSRLYQGAVRQWLCTFCRQWVSFRTMPQKKGGFKCSMCLTTPRR